MGEDESWTWWGDGDTIVDNGTGMSAGDGNEVTATTAGNDWSGYYDNGDGSYTDTNDGAIYDGATGAQVGQDNFDGTWTDTNTREIFDAQGNYLGYFDDQGNRYNADDTSYQTALDGMVDNGDGTFTDRDGQIFDAQGNYLGSIDANGNRFNPDDTPYRPTSSSTSGGVLNSLGNALKGLLGGGGTGGGSGGGSGGGQSAAQAAQKLAQAQAAGASAQQIAALQRALQLAQSASGLTTQNTILIASAAVLGVYLLTQSRRQNPVKR